MLEHFRLSDDALAGLVRIHTSGVRRFLDGLSGQARGRLEGALLVIFLAFGTAVAPEGALSILLDGLTQGSALIVVSLSAAVSSGGLWYGLARKVASIEQAEVSTLLEM